MRGSRTGKIITYEDEPDYFGYSQPLDYNDAFNFCNAFRGNIIVPENDDEMRLVQFLAQDLFSAFENENSEEDKKGAFYRSYLYANVLWVGIQFKYDRWISAKTGEEVQSEYWKDPARANSLNIAKFTIENARKEILIHSYNKLEFYSSRFWPIAFEFVLFVFF